MSLDVPASFKELWAITDATNGDLRPEYLLPVMYSESSLQPNADNGQGYYGINQIDGGTLKAKGIDPTDYKTWPASKQLRIVAGPFFKAQNAQYGPIRSGTRLYQANMCPATLPDAHSFTDVVARKGGTKYHGAEAGCYAGNAALFDTQRKGFITVGDLAAAVGRALTHPTVDAYIAAAYVFRGEPRPSVGALPAGLTPQNPVLGTDFNSAGQYVGGGSVAPPTPSGSPMSKPFPWAPVLVGGGLIGAAWLAFWYMEAGGARKVRHLLEENPTSGRAKSHVQSLLFARSEGWTPARAKRWAADHGYRHGKVHVTEDYVRLRQQSPDRFARIRTVTFGHGIKADVGFN